MQVAVMGPPGAGKTNYLAALTRAGYAFGPRANTAYVRPAPDDAGALELDRIAAEIIMGMRVLSGTQGVTPYRMIADLPGSCLFGIGAATVELVLVDHPGGDCLPPPGRPFDGVINGVLKRAGGLILLLPADSAMSRVDLASRLDHLFRQTRQLKSLAPWQPTFNRMCVCLSMAELMVARHGNDAFSQLEAIDPKEAVAGRYGPEIITMVGTAVPAGGDWYAAVSVFGFDRRTGAAAIAKDRHGRWVPRAVPGQVNEDWWPYRLFEPIEFMARGLCWKGAIES